MWSSWSTFSSLKPERATQTSISLLTWCKLIYTELFTLVRIWVKTISSILFIRSWVDCCSCTQLTWFIVISNPATCFWYFFDNKRIKVVTSKFVILVWQEAMLTRKKKRLSMLLLVGTGLLRSFSTQVNILRQSISGLQDAFLPSC